MDRALPRHAVPVGRRWIYKTDDAGAPRRFPGHREALSWAALKIGKLVGAFALFGLLGSAIETYRDGQTGWPTFTFVLAAVWLAIWLSVSLVLYLYVALSGGVMDREGRRRYLDDQRFRRRW